MYSQVTNRAQLSKVAPKAIHHHFSIIANRYRNLRATDSEPIAVVAKELRELTCVEAADIGCGDGRYDLLLCKYLGDRLRLACVDANDDMLEELDTFLRGNGVSSFAAINSTAESLPFRGGGLDCVFSFNAVHHFDLTAFLQESARVLKSGGHLFVYTRLQEQNRRNIWGRYFPGFCQREIRLHELGTFVQEVAAAPTLSLQSIKCFGYERVSSLEQLVERARAHHYFTFWLYSAEELEEAIAGFRHNIERQFEDVSEVKWFDENILFVIRKKG